MPEIEAGGCGLAYDVTGPVDAPALLLSHALTTNAGLWAPQLDAFSRAFRVIRYDTRGHGRSTVPPGEYTIERLGGDALAVLDAAGVDRAHVCGLSLGGLTAMWLGIHAPRRVNRLVLASTAARIATPDLWTERIRQVRAEGLESIADGSMARWFTAEFRQQHPDVVARHRAMVTACPRDGYLGCCAVIRDTDLSADLSEVTAPSLVISGTVDPVTPPSDGRAICDRIRGARMLTLEAAHLPNVERAEAFTTAAMAFLA